MNEPLRALTQIGSDGWLVGGAVRDRLLGRETADFDVAVPGDARALADRLSRSTNAHRFALSDDFGAWRVIARDRSWQVDLMPLMGETIEADLARRDLTINAIAEPLRGGGYVDPFAGREDLQARRLRMVGPRSFSDDPLRSLRLPRLACELGFEVQAATRSAARAAAPGLAEVAAERIFAELKRIVVADRALDGLADMDAVGATAVVLPELAELHGVQQSGYHHLDVHDHTMQVLAETIELESDPGGVLGEHGEAVARLLAEPLANELTRGQALRFGALFHDVAKPRTREVGAEGRITFMGHDAAGAEMARAALGRLRTSDRLAEHVASLTRDHLRLGFLVHHAPPSRRAVYRYMRACEPVEVDVSLLSVADRLATRGKNSAVAIARHLELARELVGEGLAWRSGPPRPPLRGDQLARAIGVPPGPEVGQILRELEEASFAGEIASTDEAIERARVLLAGRGTAIRDR
ncbi:MAG: HDIG domain-containing protein [Actinomycetota bacterium]|nr:HDIG domain-containing protein [Actinomycetota bacterium]